MSSYLDAINGVSFDNVKNYTKSMYKQHEEASEALEENIPALGNYGSKILDLGLMPITQYARATNAAKEAGLEHNYVFNPEEFHNAIDLFFNPLEETADSEEKKIFLQATKDITKKMSDFTNDFSQRLHEEIIHPSWFT